MNKKILNFGVIFLALVLCLSLTSCKKSGANTEESSVDSSEISDSNNKPKPAPTPPPIDNGNGDDGEIVDAMSNVTVDIAVGETETVLLNWKMGKVASSDFKISKTQKYSYSDVITVKNAGTTITFVDDNTNNNGDVEFADSDVLVISSWQKNHNGVWIPNGQGSSYVGTGTNISQVVVSYYNGVVTYSYTTVADNENIVLCFRSGQTETYAPESFPAVTAVFKRTIVADEVGDGYADGDKITDIF